MSDSIAIVAGLIDAEQVTIPTASDTAVAEAVVRLFVVAIIALFVAWVFGQSVNSMNAVTALGRDAVVGTGILGVPIAIITGFLTAPQDAVAATSGRTTVQTGVVFSVVSVVTEFTILNEAITTTAGHTIGTGVGRIFISVVATLSRA